MHSMLILFEIDHRDSRFVTPSIHTDCGSGMILDLPVPTLLLRRFSSRVIFLPRLGRERVLQCVEREAPQHGARDEQPLRAKTCLG